MGSPADDDGREKGSLGASSQRLVKKTVKECHGCRRFLARALGSPPSGNLPEDRTKGTYPFQTIGVDNAKPIWYKRRAKVEGKAYIALYPC